MHPGHAGNARDLVQQELLVIVHIAHHHLELVVRLLAGDEQAFQHLGNVGNGRFQAGEAFRRMLIHRDADQGHQAQAQFPGVQHGPVAGDDAGFFQRPHPAQAGRRRQADALGQVLIADAPVRLQDGKNFPVVAVNIKFIFHFRQYAQFNFKTGANDATKRKHLPRLFP